MNKIFIQDKYFELFIRKEKIDAVISVMAEQMNRDLMKKDVIFLVILNGAFMFASDLLKLITFQCMVSFLKLVSYNGASSTGEITRLIGINEDFAGKTVVILEDVIDSGLTVQYILKQLEACGAAEIKIAALLLKQLNSKVQVRTDYTGFKIPGDFVVGYGLDYNGYGRNLKSIYKITN